jgi:hypothetical protein
MRPPDIADHLPALLLARPAYTLYGSDSAATLAGYFGAVGAAGAAGCLLVKVKLSHGCAGPGLMNPVVGIQKKLTCSSL